MLKRRAKARSTVISCDTDPGKDERIPGLVEGHCPNHQVKKDPRPLGNCPAKRRKAINTTSVIEKGGGFKAAGNVQSRCIAGYSSCPAGRFDGSNRNQVADGAKPIVGCAEQHPAFCSSALGCSSGHVLRVPPQCFRTNGSLKGIHCVQDPRQRACNATAEALAKFFRVALVAATLTLLRLHGACLGG